MLAHALHDTFCAARDDGFDYCGDHWRRQLPRVRHILTADDMAVAMHEKVCPGVFQHERNPALAGCGDDAAHTERYRRWLEKVL